MAAIVVVDKRTDQILAHDVKNISHWDAQKPAPWTKENEEWFDRHVNEGLGGLK